jgi:hypothetical protein
MKSNSPCTRFLARCARFGTFKFASCMSTSLTAIRFTLLSALVVVRTRSLADVLAEEGLLTKMWSVLGSWMFDRTIIDFVYPLTITASRGTIPATTRHHPAANAIAMVLIRVDGTSEISSVLATRKWLRDRSFATNFREIVNEITRDDALFLCHFLQPV